MFLIPGMIVWSNTSQKQKYSYSLFYLLFLDSFSIHSDTHNLIWQYFLSKTENSHKPRLSVSTSLDYTIDLDSFEEVIGEKKRSQKVILAVTLWRMH